MKQEKTMLDLYEELLELNFTDLKEVPQLTANRREFLKLFGTGILILIAAPDAWAYQEGGRRRPQLPDDFNAFLRIGEDGKVTGFTGKIEMGQGAITSLAQTLAEELDVPLDWVEMVMGDTDLCPWDMGTFGSMTTRFFGPPFRAAAAEAKAVLIEMAAEKLGTAKEQLSTSDGAVVDRQTGKRVTYAELVEGKKVLRRLDGKAEVEKPSVFTIVGKPVLRSDSVEKVTGKAKFSADLREPGMLYARILRPPAHDAKLLNADLSKARQIEGVLIVEKPDLIAVLHENPDIADEALAAIQARFDEPSSKINDQTIFDHLLSVAPEGEVVAEGGTPESMPAESDEVVEHTYLDGYVAHATMEPHAALAKIDGEKVTIWASTQTPFRLKDEAASALGIPAENVRVRPPFVGGGFGGKSYNQQAVEAVRLAQAAGKPVMVSWTREEEFFYDTFRPAAVVKIKGATDSSGRITLWDYGVYFAGQRGSQQFYNIPNHRTTAFGSGWTAGPGTHPFKTGAWRAPSNNTNTFARESHIDTLAARAGMDPVEFRLKNLSDEKMKRVLKAAAERFGWTPAKAPSGRGYGVALGIDAGTYVALIAEVGVEKNTGRVSVKRVVCAQDMGLCVNPEGSTIQIEGCITMGLGYALSEEVRFEGGKVKDLNFDTYKIPRFSWVPQIESVILDAKDDPPQGGGEPAIICIGAIVANAIFDATGARLFEMPMTADRVKKALERI
ncbi:MAG: xanthine dehydrogenase family protein molybdopterin-binding subunit [Acidobacteriota bacterium]|nr:MAG: xanthine dehydrogenase family protein molybdopterin-binding subunit [Acidobacteriota bacterium]